MQGWLRIFHFSYLFLFPICLILMTHVSAETDTVKSRYLKVNPKLLIFQSKFSGFTKFTLAYQYF